MNKLGQFDLVSYKDGKETKYATVFDTKGKNAKIRTIEEDEDNCTMKDIPLALLSLVPAVELKQGQLKKVCRGELTLDAVKKGIREKKIICSASYQMTLDDLEAAIKVYRKKDQTEFEDWFNLLAYQLDEEVKIDDILDKGNTGSEDGLPDDYTIFADIWDQLEASLNFEGDYDLKCAEDDLRRYHANQKKTASKRILNDDEKMDLICFWDENDAIAEQPKDLQKAWKNALEDLCAKKDLTALEIKGYACYGDGNGVYKTDYKTCLDCLLKVFKEQPDPSIANTLGYIYYYGRTNKGKPQYAQAFKYFSIGAAGGVLQSRYKLSDMFLNGYGVGKNEETASRLLWDLYDESLDGFCRGSYDSVFADVAYRIGNLYRYGIDGREDPNEAYAYYLQAQYAIAQRIAMSSSYGDLQVQKNIEESIAAVLPNTIYEKKTSVIHRHTAENFLTSALAHHAMFKIKIKELKNHKKHLSIYIVNDDEEFPLRFLMVLPEAGTCQLMDNINLTVQDLQEYNVPADSDSFLFNDIRDAKFYLYGTELASIEGEYVYKAKK
jgi:hypothetical protein